MDQHGGDGRIHTAGKTADHPALADLGTNLLDCLLAECAHRPVALKAGDLAHEIPDQLCTIRRVHHFRVEHQAVILPLLVLDDRERRVCGNTGDLKTRWHPGDTVTMAHPYFVVLADLPGLLEQTARCFHFNVRAAELAMMTTLDLAAELRRHRHLAIADAKHRHAGLEYDLRRPRRALLVHRRRTAGENHRLRPHLAKCLLGLLERHDLRIDAIFAHPARDQLSDLAAEIDDENLVVERCRRRRRLELLLGWGHGKELRELPRCRNRATGRSTCDFAGSINKGQ